jgi:hypothetical protein
MIFHYKGRTYWKRLEPETPNTFYLFCIYSANCQSCLYYDGKNCSRLVEIELTCNNSCPFFRENKKRCILDFTQEPGKICRITAIE